MRTSRRRRNQHILPALAADTPKPKEFLNLDQARDEFRPELNAEAFRAWVYRNDIPRKKIGGRLFFRRSLLEQVFAA